MTGPSPADVVIDTNCVLDLWLFDDPAMDTLKQAIHAGAVRWIAAPAMRDELARVLAYPLVAAQLARRRRTSDEVLAAFDRWVHPRAPAGAAPVRCRDPADQMFIDLAVAEGAALFSKDKAVTALARRLAPLGVAVAGGSAAVIE